VVIKDLPSALKGTIKRLKHPDFSQRGYRELPFDGKVYLDKNDLMNNKNKVLRLMDGINIFIGEDVIYHSSTLEDARKVNARIVHWVPYSSNNPVEVIMPDANTASGFIEPSSSELKVDDVVQLERVGFARLDSEQGGKLTFYFAHK
jgi:glutamyl-tRNA synthetase